MTGTKKIHSKYQFPQPLNKEVRLVNGDRKNVEVEILVEVKW